MVSFYFAPRDAFVRGHVLALEPRADHQHASITTVATIRVADSYGVKDCDVGERVEFDCTFAWPPLPEQVVGRDLTFSMGWARNARKGKPFVQTRWQVEPGARDGTA